MASKITCSGIFSGVGWLFEDMTKYHVLLQNWLHVNLSLFTGDLLLVR